MCASAGLCDVLYFDLLGLMINTIEVLLTAVSSCEFFHLCTGHNNIHGMLATHVHTQCLHETCSSGL